MDGRIKGLFLKAALLLMVCSVFFQASDVSAAPAKAGWHKSGNTWYYYNSQESKMTNCWKQDSSYRWFYLGADGAMVTNSAAKDSSGRWFYLGTDGAMVTNRWVLNSGNWYYYGQDGAMLTSRWQQDSSMQWFYLGADGVMVADCTKQDSSAKWFYLGPDGAMVTNSWEVISGTHFYFGADGTMVINSWVETDGKWYYLNAGGDMAFSTVTPDGYTVDENGVRVDRSTDSHLRISSVDITGDRKIGSVLTAGPLIPAAAEVNYQWQISSDGLAFTNIEGATANTFTIPKGSADKYFRVSAKGVNRYAGTVFSTAKLAERIVLTASAEADDKTYDGTGAATGTITLSGIIEGDNVSAAGTFTFDNKNAGTGKTVTVTGITLSGEDVCDYTAGTTATTLADINARLLTVTAAGMDKEYDGSNVATVTLSTDKLADDDVAAEYTSALYDNKNVGAEKAVTVSGISISGADAGSYSLNNTTDVTAADITQKALIASVSSVTGKTYDGTAAASGTLSLAVMAGSDDVSAAGTFEFASSNAGIDIPVNVTGITLTGGDAGNYTVNSTATATGTIDPILLTATATADDKIYDGTTAATGKISLEGILGTDDVSGAGTFTFDSAAVGNNIAVNISNIYLAGSGAGNYSVNETEAANADIYVKELTITGLSANNKTYDGTTNATVTGTASLNGIVSGDEGEVALSVTPVFTFAKPDTDNGIKVNISGVTLSGTKSGNYTLTLPELMADITPATPVVDTWATSSEIVYGQKLSESILSGGNALFNEMNIDGTFSFTATESLNPSTFTPDAGNYEAAVTFTPDSVNYSSFSGSINVKVNAKPIIVAADHKTKIYGSADPDFTWTITGGSLVEGDELSGELSRAAGEDAGSYAIGQGTLSNSNYYITYIPADMDITPAALTLAAAPLAESITYGDSLSSSELGNGTMLYGEVPAAGVFSFTNPDTVPSAGVYKADITFDPTSDNFENYAFIVDVVVNPKPITVTPDNLSKTYGEEDPELTFSVSESLFCDDEFTGALTRATGENVGAHQITQGSLALGADYTLTFASEPKYLTINALSITVTPDNLSKTYGEADPVLTYTTSVPLAGVDSFTGTLTRTAGENAGLYEISSGTLALSSNYTLNFSAATKYLQINKREITVSAIDIEKTYGNTYNFAGTEFTCSGMAGTDSISRVTLNSIGAGSSAAPGTYMIMPIGAVAGPGTDFNNYSITYEYGTMTVNPAPYAGTGHYYEFISDPGITWQEAEAAASQKSYNGWQGYLATITSAGENEFVKNACQGQGWLGGSDDEFEGEPKDYWEGDWIWAVGPEKGHSIYEYGYMNWAGGEPNNAGDEDYMHMYGPYDGSAGQWNDYAWNNPYIIGYIIEYGGL